MSDYGHCIDLLGSDFDEPQPADPLTRIWSSAADQLQWDGLAIPMMSRPFPGGAPVTQSFGGRHYGVDWGIPTGTPLYACHAGQVVAARSDTTGYGWVICIKSDALGVYTVYGHLNYAAGITVRTGQWVAEREHIGYSDNTGNSTGPHLHLELRVRPYGYPGACVNPLPYLAAWSTQPAPPTPPPTSSRARTLRNAPVRPTKKATGKIGVYPAGVLLAVGSDNGAWTWVPAQMGRPAGFVKSAHLVRV